MNNNQEFKNEVEELLKKSNQFDLKIQELEANIAAQEEELNMLTKKITTSKTSLALLHDEAEEISLEIKMLLKKSS